MSSILKSKPGRSGGRESAFLVEKTSLKVFQEVGGRVPVDVGEESMYG